MARALSKKGGEGIFAAALLLIIFSFILVAKINGRKASSLIALHPAAQKEILITIDGAVKKPGSYLVLAGSPLKLAIHKAKPNPDANLKNLPLQMPVENPLHITVEPLKEIQVFVTGAIAQPVEVTLPPGSRLCDLKSKVIFTSDTEKTFFRRRKLLKDGDQIVVPKKTVE